MGVNSLPKTVTLWCHGCDLNPGPSVPESSTLTTWLPSHPPTVAVTVMLFCLLSNFLPTLVIVWFILWVVCVCVGLCMSVMQSECLYGWS